MVPHVVYAPVLFQPVCDSAVAADNVFRGSLFLSFLPHDVGEKRNDELAYVSAVVQLSVYEFIRNVVHEELAHLRFVVLVLRFHMAHVFLGRENFHGASHAERYLFALVLLDEFISEHTVLQLVHLSFADYFIRERVVEIARLWYHVLYLVCRSEEFGKWNHLSSIW